VGGPSRRGFSTAVFLVLSTETIAGIAVVRLKRVGRRLPAPPSSSLSLVVTGSYPIGCQPTPHCSCLERSA
jgi:hypothetical protein